jgi:toxin ParE1/3/4
MTWGAARAGRYGDSLERTIERALIHPDSGVAMDELPEVRSVLSGSHRIYYRHGPDWLRAVRVLHTSMDVPRHLP